MKQSEFLTVPKYLLKLKDQKADPKYESLLKGKDFFNTMPLIVEKYPAMLVRDNLDVDNTFAVIFPRSHSWTFLESLDFHDSMQAMLGIATYTHVRNIGYIEYEDSVGVWYLVA